MANPTKYRIVLPTGVAAHKDNFTWFHDESSAWLDAFMSGTGYRYDPNAREAGRLELSKRVEEWRTMVARSHYRVEVDGPDGREFRKP